MRAASGPAAGRARVVRAILGALLCAALGSASATAMHFERIGTDSGPLPDVVTAVFQDHVGFIWIGSRDGLFLYDGYTFRSFEHDAADPASLSDNAIRTIYEDREGRLWVGTNSGGLARLDRARWSFQTWRHDASRDDSLSHDSVYSILEDRSGNLWVGTQVGLNRLDPATGKIRRFLADPSAPGSLSNNYVTKILADREGRLWVATLGGGLNRWDPDTDTFRAFGLELEGPGRLPDNRLLTIAEAPSGGLWLGTITGLVRMELGEDGLPTFHPGAETLSTTVNALAPGPSGNLWVGTFGAGLGELDPRDGEVRRWRHEPGDRWGLGSDQILDLLVDATGGLWIATWGSGLQRVTATSIELPLVVPVPGVELEQNDVTTLMQDAAGGLWIGSRGGDLVRLANGKQRVYSRGGFPASNKTILSAAEDGAGDVWVGTNGGLVRIEPDSGDVHVWTHEPGDPEALGPGYVKALLVDRRGRLWVGTGEGGLQRLSPDGRVRERHVSVPGDPDSLSDDYVTTIVEDRNGILWVGTRSGGLNAFDPETARNVRYVPDPEDPSAISHHFVTSILEDAAGRLWVGTSGGGLNLLRRPEEGGGFEHILETDGLVDNDVMGLLQDEDGSLWISTRRGLSRFDPEARAFAAIQVYDGLPSAEFEPGSAARGGVMLYFGSIRGVVGVPSGITLPEPVASPMVVSSIRTSAGLVRADSPTWELEQLEIPYGEWLAVELAVLDYSPERRHRYSYRMHEDWIDLASRREITFTDLRPGRHRFEARGRNSEGVWSEAGALSVQVIPPFWMTYWFRGLLALLVLAGAILGHRMRLSALTRRNRELVELHLQRETAQRKLAMAYDRLRQLTRRLEIAKEQERKHIARELHDELGPSLTAVIINLQLLARRADPEGQEKCRDAIELVDRLVQKVRDLSLDLRPPLLDELGFVPALRGYLEAHSDRSGLQIELEADPPPERLPADVEITAFRFVQEAITNVVRHAAAQGVRVTVQRSEESLNLRVEDDGKGFEVAETMSASSGRSLGLLGMQERVRMLGGEVEIRSLPGQGTHIEARIPLEIAS